MRIIGCDLHPAKQAIAMLDRDTGEVVQQTLSHDGETVRECYAAIPKPAVVGIEATGSMACFVRLMEELGIACRVSHPAAIHTAEPRRQKHDRRDAQLLMRLLGSISGDLDADGGTARSASPAPPPSSMGAHANARQHALQAIALGQGFVGAAGCGAPKAKPSPRRCRSYHTH
jgi:hypothetical protein